MLRYILYDLTAFGAGEDRDQVEKDLCMAMQFLSYRNQNYLKANPSTPRLYESGVKWSAPKQLNGDVEEVQILVKALGAAARGGDVRRVLDKIQDILGGEHFCDIGRILELGEIDCDGIASWRVAELRQMGIQAQPFMRCRERPDGGTTYHALVIWPPLGPCNYETSEDPSLLLGMSQPERAADRQEELRKNAERCDILKRYGRAAIRPYGSATSLIPPAFEGAAIDAIVSAMLGAKRAA